MTIITDTLHENQYTFLITSRSILLRMRNVKDKVVQKIKTHILCSVPFFENRTAFEILWKNMAQPDRPQHDNMAHAHCMLDT